MGGQRGGQSSNQAQAFQQAPHQPSKRRNTVHSTLPAAAPSAAWLPSIPTYAPLQPTFLPLYPPLWQLPQFAGLNQGVLLQSTTPIPTGQAPSTQSGRSSTARPSSPHKAERHRARSPERRSDGGHGNRSYSKRGKGGRSSMTTRDNTATMSGRNLDLSQASLTMPPLHDTKSSISHQSNSVPSTPQQHATGLSFRSRTPSPGGLTNHSPRSTHSESNSHLPPLRRPTGCKFETGMAFSKRRIPYSIGTDRLEKAKVAPKKNLRPSDEKKLTRDMGELYSNLLPSVESEKRRATFVGKLEKMLNKEWPGSDIQVRVFGSSGNLLCTSVSDVDICITTTLKDLEKVCLLANALAENGMERVVCVPNAKVPIVKFWDPELELACDMNVNNTLALENTRMIKLYVEIDERVRLLAMIIKHWTKKRILNDAALGGTLSSYTWICMIVNFLQTRKPPILPALHQRPHQKRAGVESSFADDLDSLVNFGKPNTETLGELLYQFFRLYGHEINYDTSVISVRQGKLTSKEEKGWHLMQNNSLCVEEPFNTSRNLGNTADETAFRGLHLELRRACSLIGDEANLEACCEQYVFPPEEERIWEKPPPQPKPILSRTGSQTQSGRGGRGGSGSMRGNRHNNNHGFRGANSNRRSSSSASLSNAPFNNLQHPQLGLPLQDQLRHSQAQLQLHDQLYQSYQVLQARELELRMRQAQAHAQAQVMAQSQARGENPPSTSAQATLNYLNAQYQAYTGSFENPPLTAPLRPDMFVYPLQYAPAPAPAPAQSYVQAGTNTNPSSPSMTPAVPEFRRSLQRSQVADGSGSGSLRSQSQPARTLPSPLALHGLSASNFGFNALGLQAVPQIQEYSGEYGSNAGLDPTTLQGPDLPFGSPPTDDGMPKEYLGYYVGGSPPMQHYQSETGLQPVPVFGELTTRQPRHSPDQRIIDRLHLGSRSPSPLGRTRARSNESRPMGIKHQTNGIPSANRSLDPRGPLIVDGSNPAIPADNGHQLYMSETTSASDDHSSDTPATTAETHYQDQPDGGAATLSSQFLVNSPVETYDHAGGPGSDLAHAWSGPGQHNPIKAGSHPTSPRRAVPAGNDASQRARSHKDREDSASASASPQTGATHSNARKSGAAPESNRVIATSHALRDIVAPVTPLLSPVYERRTPSPTAIKKIEGPQEPKVNGLASNSRTSRSAEMQPPPTPAPMGDEAEEAAGSNDTSNGHITGSLSASGSVNGWTPASKNKKKRLSGKKGSGPAVIPGEMIPADESKRKGG